MYEQLFDNMYYHVTQEMSHHQKLLAHYQREIQLHATSTTTYYWVVTAESMNLFNLRDLVVDLPDWNLLKGFAFYNNYSNKHLYRIQIIELNDTLDGLLMPMEFTKVYQNLCKSQKTPYGIALFTKDKYLELPIAKALTKTAAFARFCIALQDKNINWESINYEFLY